MALSSGNDFVEQSPGAKSSLFPYLPIRNLFCASVGGSVGMLFISRPFLLQGKPLARFTS